MRQKECRDSPGSDLDDVVSAEHSTSVASVSVLSDGALHLKDAQHEHHDSIKRQTNYQLLLLSLSNMSTSRLHEASAE